MEPSIVIQPEGVRIPAVLCDLDAFRQWARSDAFPDRGRIDWIGGEVEVDMSPENLPTHGSPKTAITMSLGRLIYETRRGHVYIDRGRLTCPDAGLSVEPDILVVLTSTLETGRAKFVQRPDEPEGSIELEGAADLAVEIVGKTSVRKDTVRLRELYHRAGVREYWIVDARRNPPSFELLVHRPGGYEAVLPDGDGYYRSDLVGAQVRFVREGESGGWVYFRLDVRPV